MMHVEGKHGVDSTRFEAVQIHMMPPKLMVQIIYVRVSRKYLFGEVLNGKDLGENAGNTKQVIPQQKKLLMALWDVQAVLRLGQPRIQALGGVCIRFRCIRVLQVDPHRPSHPN